LGLAEGTTMASQVWSQFVGVAFTIIYCAVLSFVILKIVDALVGLRVTEEDEDRGLDISLHNEQGYYSDV
jgi:Amt family ammonium transporter